MSFLDIATCFVDALYHDEDCEKFISKEFLFVWKAEKEQLKMKIFKEVSNDFNELGFVDPVQDGDKASVKVAVVPEEFPADVPHFILRLKKIKYEWKIIF